MRRLSFADAKRLCGISSLQRLDTDDDYAAVNAAWKSRMVAARNAGDEEEAKVLSQAHQVFKRRYISAVSRVCPDCGQSKSLFAMRCGRCSRIYRFYRHMIPQPVLKDYELEQAAVPVPPRKHMPGKLAIAMLKLSNSQVGDSFVCGNASATIKNAAAAVGLQVIVRIANVEETDKKKRKFRVWRSDGLESEAVNEVIEKRRKGEVVPPPEKCVPLSTEEQRKRRHR